MKNEVKERLILSAIRLGEAMAQEIADKSTHQKKTHKTDSQSFDSVLIQKIKYHNPWFTPENSCYQFNHWSNLLTRKNLEKWIGNFRIPLFPKKVGLIMAGNIPLVGLHDLLAVYLAGHEAHVKLSSKDSVAMQWLIDLLNSHWSEPRILQPERLTYVDALVATGSDNSSRYFEYYFKDTPRIIRKNRTSVAVLNGNESSAELEALGNDMFRYFGLGCRNVTQLFVPEGYPIHGLIEALAAWKFISTHDKYSNNLRYYQTILALQGQEFLDAGFFTLVHSDSLFSQLSVVNIKEYKNLEEVELFLKQNQGLIQCIVSKEIQGALPFGESQMPGLNDYADGVDVLNFLAGV